MSMARGRAKRRSGHWGGRPLPAVALLLLLLLVVAAAAVVVPVVVVVAGRGAAGGPRGAVGNAGGMHSRPLFRASRSVPCRHRHRYRYRHRYRSQSLVGIKGPCSWVQCGTHHKTIL
jgi:hypothetical protein